MPNNLPEEMTKKFNSTCKEISCMAKKAGKELHYRFVIKKNSSNIFPGKMIQAMAWYEILYLDKLKNNELFIKRYLENYPNEYKNKIIDEIKIQSVLSMFEGRKNMRNALGIPNDEKPNVAINRFWLMGQFLNQGKPKNREVDESLLKRKDLLEEYKMQVKMLKLKLEQKKTEDNESIKNTP